MVTEVGKLVFIGGAPRSGTTLLSNMLDSHPDFLVFPMEHAVFETYFNCPDKNVFHSKFITDRALGQQAILGNSEAYQAYEQKVRRVLKRDWLLQIDSGLFRKEYESSISQRSISLQSVFLALMGALCKSSEYHRDKLATAKFWVFKQPFYTELYCDRARKELEATFLHVVRDVLSRYSSAKARRIRTVEGKIKNSSLINRRPANLGHCEVSIISHWLAHRNSEHFDNYHTVDFGNLRGPDRQEYAADLLLRLGTFESELHPKEAGRPVLPNSSFQDQNRPANDLTAYEQLTNRAERAVNSYFLSCVSSQLPWLGFKKFSMVKALSYWWLRFKYEGWRDYCIRIALSFQLLRQIRHYDCEKRLADILRRVKSKQFAISGET